MTQPHPPQQPLPPQRQTNVLAIISLVASIVGIFSGIGFLVGVICGHIANKQIAQTGEEGAGYAKAGLIIGYIGIGLSVLATLLIIISMFAMAGAAAV